MSSPVAIVIGTRPEAIKLAPVAEALVRRGIAPRLILTGQHPLMPSDFALAGYPNVILDCRGGLDPRRHVRDVRQAVAPLVSDCAIVIVQGDTSSALGGALAAADGQVPVAHVEAGLRTHDRRQPWPEEDFRREIDQLATILFAPTELSGANLRRERVRGGITVTGNTGIDAALRHRPVERPREDAESPTILVTCHRRESWGAGLESIAAALRKIAEADLAQVDVLLHPRPGTAGQLRHALSGASGIRLFPPLNHAETIERVIAADLVLSDSGGLQEECSALGVPMLVLRDRTERPEAIASGNMRLVGIDPGCIFDGVAHALSSARHPRSRHCPYGDGYASDRIAAVIDDWLEMTSPIVLLHAG